MSFGAPALATGSDSAPCDRPRWLPRLVAVAALAALFSSLNVGAILGSFATSAGTTSIPLRATSTHDVAPAENAYAADLTSQLTSALAAGSGDAAWIAQQRMVAMRTLLDR